MKKNKAIRMLRKRLREALILIEREHICDGCCTGLGGHEKHCKYEVALSMTANYAKPATATT